MEVVNRGTEIVLSEEEAVLLTKFLGNISLVDMKGLVPDANKVYDITSGLYDLLAAKGYDKEDI